jgi:hypothetical protein
MNDAEHIDITKVPPVTTPIDTQRLRDEIRRTQAEFSHGQTQPMKTIKRIQFFPEFGLGDILQIIALAATVFGVYLALDKRVTVVEEAVKYQLVRDAQQDERARESQEQVRDTLREIKAGVEKLNDRMDRAK